MRAFTVCACCSCSLWTSSPASGRGEGLGGILGSAWVQTVIGVSPNLLDLSVLTPSVVVVYLPAHHGGLDICRPSTKPCWRTTHDVELWRDSPCTTHRSLLAAEKKDRV